MTVTTGQILLCVFNAWSAKYVVYHVLARKSHQLMRQQRHKQAVRLNLPSIVTVRLVSVASPYSGQVTNLDQSRSF